MKTLNVLHLASFTGNIGDNANHMGSKILFEKYIGRKFEIQRVEIREFYRKKRFFDSSFIDEINTYDLFMVGGGNYFELWPQNSRSGTSIDFGVEELKQIKTPTIFYSLGVDPGQGVTESNKLKFEKFLDYLSQDPKFFISVRNDGALGNIAELYGEKRFPKVYQIPDGGFYSNSYFENIRDVDEKLIGINLAGDMLDARFQFGEDLFIKEMVSTLSELLIKNRDHKLVFFNHIPKDTLLSSKILNLLPDDLARQRVLVAPYEQGDSGADKVFRIYSSCEVILGNRFHANVVPISMKIPTIGLYNYIQIKNLFKELNLEDYLVDISQRDFKTNLLNKVQSVLENRELHVSKFQNVKIKIDNEAKDAFIKVKQWFDLNKL